MRHWFISSNYRNQAKFTLFVLVLAFCVILLGAYTRLTDAGLSCPDWPHCYGYLVAPHTESQLQNATIRYPEMPVNVKKAWTEMAHRYLAATLGICIIILASSLLFSRKAKETKSFFIGILLLALLAAQVAFGMLTVTAKLKPIIVTTHLIMGISLLALLWWTYLDVHLRDDAFLQRIHHRLNPWLALGFLIVVAQILLGGWVSTHYAGLACIDFPYCNNLLLPKLQLNKIDSDLITIHMLHRIGALITTIYVGILGLFLLSQQTFRHLGVLLLAFLSLQVMLGILNIIWLRPIWLALFHQGVAILLLLTLETILIKAAMQLRAKYYAY